MVLNDNKLTVSYTMRVPIKLMEDIKADIERRGDYNSVSQWVNTACREFLQKRQREWNEINYGKKE